MNLKGKELEIVRNALRRAISDVHTTKATLTPGANVDTDTEIGDLEDEADDYQSLLVKVEEGVARENPHV